MRLKQHDDATIGRPDARCAECRFNFRRMMAIVIDDRNPLLVSFELEAPIGATEFRQRMNDSVEGDVQLKPNGNRCQRVINVVFARYAQRHFAEHVNAT